MANVKVFNDSVVELPEQAAAPHGLTVTAARPEHSQEVMPLTFSLKIPQTLHDELEAKVAKGIVVPIDELNTKYAVSVREVDGLVDWLKGQGFEVTKVAKDGTSVYA